MPAPLLIYGATGVSGRHLVRAAARLPDAASKVLLAGRDGAALRQLSDQHGLDFRVFGLDDPQEVRRGIEGVGVVLNAAGPFAFTAERLAKSAIAAGCHYADINGEADVYRRLDDLDRYASDRGVALACGAGFTATVSSMLMEQALAGPLSGLREVGAVRIAFSAVDELSRGSLQVVWRSMREQVLVVRPDALRPERAATAWVPQGGLQRRFVFQTDVAGAPRSATASAVNLVDTLTAWRALASRRMRVQSIESYVETGPLAQLALDAAALAAPMAGMRLLRRAVSLALGTLPPELGTTAPGARSAQRQAVVLQVEDGWQRMLVDWCVAAPDPYEATAPLALAVAEVLRQHGSRMPGWRTPGEVLSHAEGLLKPGLWKGFEVMHRTGAPR